MLDKTPGIIYEGKLEAKGLKFAIVRGRFNSFFVDRLLEGAMDAIRKKYGRGAVTRASLMNEVTVKRVGKKD